jgi:hypothetical protein
MKIPADVFELLLAEKLNGGDSSLAKDDFYVFVCECAQTGIDVEIKILFGCGN